jgi:hypothetical protein
MGRLVGRCGDYDYEHEHDYDYEHEHDYDYDYEHEHEHEHEHDYEHEHEHEQERGGSTGLARAIVRLAAGDRLRPVSCRIPSRRLRT